MKPLDDRSPSGCCDDSCSPASSLDRREFLKLTSAGVAGVGLSSLPLMAGPFSEELDKAHPIPLDKKLSPDWVKSLYERGQPTRYRGWEELRFIGMPVGGVAAGTVYLGGDGQLWCWDISHEHHEGCIPNRVEGIPELAAHDRTVRERDGANFVQPTADQSSPWSVAQGFVLKTEGVSTQQIRLLNRHGFKDISFTGQYPIGTVEYRDNACPLEIDLQAFSPFIPLDVEQSSYPATILRYTLTNKSDQVQSASIVGYLENPALRRHRQRQDAQLVLSKLDQGFVGAAAPRPEIDKQQFCDDILLADFEWDDWGDWKPTGEAFAGGPFPQSELNAVQDSTGFAGNRFVNTYNTRVW